MKKQGTILLLSLAAATAGLTACNGAGSSGSSPSISAEVTSTNSCSALGPGESCEITLTYNPNGVVGATFGTTPPNSELKSTYPNLFNTTNNKGKNVWADSYAACSLKIPAQLSGQDTCVVYIQNNGNTTINEFKLQFNYGPTVSNGIMVGASS